MEQYEGDVKKGKSKWMLWVVIGAVAIIAIIAAVKLGGGGPSSASGLTLDELSAIVSQQSASIQGVSQWKATATEDLANLNTKQQQILSQLSGITNPKDWTSDINGLKANFTAIQASWAGVNQTIEDAMAAINITIPRYAMVSSMYKGTITGYIGDVFTDVTVYGGGNYPIVVTFYGDSLGNSTLWLPWNPHYTANLLQVSNYTCVSGTSQVDVGNGTTISVPNYHCSSNVVQSVVFISPKVGGWEPIDVINLRLVPNGAKIEYAAAVIGSSWLPTSGGSPSGWQPVG